MSKPLVVSALLLLSPIGVPWTAQPAAQVPFTIEVVASEGQTGLYPSLALDAVDTPHISYRDLTLQCQMYATKQAGAWVFEIVDNSGNVGGYTSLALDTAGRPHVCYRSVTGNSLKYAVRDGGIWTTEVVDNTSNTGYYASLALDSHGDPHISYYDVTLSALKYAHRTASGWTRETVDNTGDMGQYSSIALTNQDQPCISYYDGVNTSLRYARKVSVDWMRELVDDGGVHCGEWGSLALDSQDRPYISYQYYDGSTYYVRLAKKTTGVWTYEYAAFSGDQTSLELDSADNPCISYRGTQSLRYAYKSGGTWNVQQVDTGSGMGENSWLALSRYNMPQIAYFDNGADDLRCAWSTDPQHVAVPVAPKPTVLRIEGLSPNPSCLERGRALISFELGRPTSVELRLFDLQGRMIREESVLPWEPSGRHTFGVQAAGLEPGTYFLELRTREGATASTRWVILR